MSAKAVRTGGTFSRRKTRTTVRPSPIPAFRRGTDRRLSLRTHAQERSTTTPTTDRRLSVSIRLDLPWSQCWGGKTHERGGTKQAAHAIRLKHTWVIAAFLS